MNTRWVIVLSVLGLLPLAVMAEIDDLPTGQQDVRYSKAYHYHDNEKCHVIHQVINNHYYGDRRTAPVVQYRYDSKGFRSGFNPQYNQRSSGQRFRDNRQNQNFHQQYHQRFQKYQ